MENIKKNIILNKFDSVCKDIYERYNRVMVIDNFIDTSDFYTNNNITNFYLNKNESFDNFKDLWEQNLEKCREEDYSYDEIIDEFIKKTDEKIDFFELGCLNISTESIYDLMI